MRFLPEGFNGLVVFLSAGEQILVGQVGQSQQKVAGNGSWIYTGMGARLEWALLNYFIDSHIQKGYTFMLPPYMLNYECGLTAGQF